MHTVALYIVIQMWIYLFHITAIVNAERMNNTTSKTLTMTPIQITSIARITLSKFSDVLSKLT